MFLSVEQLKGDMGVDERIGRFFVDRRIPENNRFWRDRLLYISSGNGYVYIPVYYDLLMRIGVPVESILNESHVQFMEQLLDFAMRHEYEEITKQQEMAATRGLLSGRVTDADQFEKLNDYLDQHSLSPLNGFGTSWTALNRADAYLYILCDLPLNREQWQLAVEGWYALVPFFLTLDDIKDYEKDVERGEENVVMSLGGGQEGFEKAYELLEMNVAALKPFNPLLADFLGGFLVQEKQDLVKHA